MTPKGFQLPNNEADCEVCGSRFNRRWGTEISGLFVCTLCNRFRHMVHAMRYVRFMADKDCEQPLDQFEDFVPSWMDWKTADHCSLKCSCDTCSARKVLRFIDQWLASHGGRR